MCNLLWFLKVTFVTVSIEVKLGLRWYFYVFIMFYQPYATNNCDSTAWEHLESRGHSRCISVFLMEREKCLSHIKPGNFKFEGN